MNLRYNLQENSPSSGTVTALGIYILASLISIVIAWIEYALVLSLHRYNKDRRKKEENIDADMKNQENNHKFQTVLTKENYAVEVRDIKTKLFDIHRIERLALFSHISLIFIFNLLYWLKFQYALL